MTAGRLPAALMLSRLPASLDFVTLPLLGFSAIGDTARCAPRYLALREDRSSREPTSEPVADDWELCRRGIAGRRLEDEDATKAPVFFLDKPLVIFLCLSFAARLACFDWDAAVPWALADESASLSFVSSSTSDPGGETKRAVGRGPDVEGPLGFFRIGWDGGGLEEDEGMVFGTCIFPDRSSPSEFWRLGVLLRICEVS